MHHNEHFEVSFIKKEKIKFDMFTVRLEPRIRLSFRFGLRPVPQAGFLDGGT